MKEKMGDKQRLLHILEAISEIENYTNKVEVEVFLSNSMMRFVQSNKLKLLEKLPTM